MILIKHSHPLYVPIYPVYRVTTGPGAYARRLRAQGGVIFIMTVTSALLIKDLNLNLHICKVTWIKNLLEILYIHFFFYKKL